jgi:hypothetical protein
MICASHHGPDNCTGLPSVAMVRCPERRTMSRFPVAGVNVSISVRLRFGNHQGTVVDFNRSGITVELPRALPLNKQLLVTLRCPGAHPEAIVSTAHTCHTTRRGVYRCGIRFRTDSSIQLDRDDVEAALCALEASFAKATSTEAT